MKNPPLVDPLSWTLGMLSGQIQTVRKEAKPVAEITIHKKYLSESIKEILDRCLSYIVVNKDQTHITIFIFKYPHLTHIINYSIGKKHDEKILRVWLDGKMFGYSEYGISQYLETI